MARFKFAALIAAAWGLGMLQAHADILPRMPGPPFTTTLSNHPPLVFGMAPETVANVLQAPLTYVSGRPGNEIFLAVSTVGGSLFFPRRDRLYLQFRHDRLTGWKGDWGHNWMWR